MRAHRILLSIITAAVCMAGANEASAQIFVPPHVILSPTPLESSEVGARVADRGDFDLNGGAGDPDQLWTAWGNETADFINFKTIPASAGGGTWDTLTTLVGLDRYYGRTYWGATASWTGQTGDVPNPAHVVTLGAYMAPIINESNDWVGYLLMTGNYVHYSAAAVTGIAGFVDNGISYSGDYNLLYRGSKLGGFRVRLAAGYEGFHLNFAEGVPGGPSGAEDDSGFHLGGQLEYPLAPSALGQMTPYARLDYILASFEDDIVLPPPQINLNANRTPTEVAVGVRSDIAPTWTVGLEGSYKVNFDINAVSNEYNEYAVKLAIYKRF